MARLVYRWNVPTLCKYWQNLKGRLTLSQFLSSREKYIALDLRRQEADWIEGKFKALSLLTLAFRLETNVDAVRNLKAYRILLDDEFVGTLLVNPDVRARPIK